MRNGHGRDSSSARLADVGIGLATLDPEAAQQGTSHFLVAPHAEVKNEHAAAAIDGVGDVPNPLGPLGYPRNNFHQPRSTHQQEQLHVQVQSADRI